jgi:tetratricopeptide (TPR) repeat protein
MTQADTKLAEKLEADAMAYPEERAENLLEAAAAWQRAGRRERAIELLAELVNNGGEYGCDARVQLADLYLQAGDSELAHAHLAAAAKDPALGQRQCEIAAEMLAEHGDLAHAARWYDRAAARLTEDQLDALRSRDSWLSIATTMMLRGRQDVRRRLGRTPDMLDNLVPDPPSANEPFTSNDVLELMDAGITPAKTRVLTFQRDQRRIAQQRWPDLYTQSDDEYYPAAEQQWRHLRDGGIPSIAVVPADIDALTTFATQIGGSPTDAGVKRRYCQSIPDRDTITWPPERNAACWCGSSRKYKKCCGRPA